MSEDQVHEGVVVVVPVVVVVVVVDPQKHMADPRKKPPFFSASRHPNSIFGSPDLPQAV